MILTDIIDKRNEDEVYKMNYSIAELKYFY